MSKKTTFGKKIPNIREIVKIDGDTLIDADGDEFDRGLIELTSKLGGSWELFTDLEDEPSDRE